MAQITSYAGLQVEVANEVNRSDLTSDIPRFVQSAESVLRRDPRVKRLRVTPTFAVSAETANVPANFKALDSISHIGTGQYAGDLKVVSPGDLSVVKRDLTTSGAPRVVCYHNGVLRFAPVPDQEYTMYLSWWENVPRLSDTVQSNWLLQDHSDIYLYGTLMEVAPFLKDDARITVWETILDRRLEELHQFTQAQTYSGPISSPPAYTY